AYGSETSARRRRRPARKTTAQSAALAWTTKLRVNLPRARTDRPARGSSAPGSSGSAVRPRQSLDGGGQGRPRRGPATLPSPPSPPPPAPAAGPTSGGPGGTGAVSPAKRAPPSPAAPPYMADNRAILALPRSPPNAPASAW